MYIKITSIVVSPHHIIIRVREIGLSPCIITIYFGREYNIVLEIIEIDQCFQTS